MSNWLKYIGTHDRNVKINFPAVLYKVESNIIGKNSSNLNRDKEPILLLQSVK